MINSFVTKYVGSSTNVGVYSFGDICQNTCLRLLTHSINRGFNGPLGDSTYGNLISIGSQASSFNPTAITSDPNGFTVTGSFGLFPVGTIVRIVNATPVAYNGSWTITQSSAGSFTVGTNIDPGAATVTGSVYYNTSVPGLGNSRPISFDWEGAPGWGGSLYKETNPATQWGMVRLYAWQAYNDFNFNNGLAYGYADFTASFNTAYSFIENTNQYILSMSNARYFLDGTYSNMNDLITSDLAGVSLALPSFGQDLINLGKALDLPTINTFGLPSNLLKTLVQYNALTKSVTLALIASGFSTGELGDLIGGIITPNPAQEQSIYAAFNVVAGEELQEVLVSLNCRTNGIGVLADLLNPIKIFPLSYNSLTVPVYNTNPRPITAAETGALTALTVQQGPLVAVALDSSIKFITELGITFQQGIGSIKQSVATENIPSAPYFDPYSTGYVGSGTLADPYRNPNIAIEIQAATTPVQSTANINTQNALPNSKIYFPIYGTGSINAALLSTSLTDKVGAYIPPTVPYTGFQSTTQGSNTGNGTGNSNQTVYTGSPSSGSQNNTGSATGGGNTGGGSTTTPVVGPSSSSSGGGSVRVGGVQNFDAYGNYIEPTPRRRDPNWDYSKYETSNEALIVNARHDQEYFADEFYRDKTPPQDRTGFDALPNDTRRQLIAEYITAYGVGIPSTYVSGTDSEGRLWINDGPGPRPPISADEYVERVARERGYLDAQGKSTLPLSQQQIRDQEEWDRYYQPNIEAAILRKLKGEQALAPGETIEDIKARAAKFNVSIPPATTSAPGSGTAPSGTTTRPSTQTKTGASPTNQAIQSELDALAATKDPAQLQQYLATTQYSAAELAAASGYNVADVQAAIDKAKEAAAPPPVPIPVVPPPSNPTPPPNSANWEEVYNSYNGNGPPPGPEQYYGGY